MKPLLPRIKAHLGALPKRAIVFLPLAAVVLPVIRLMSRRYLIRWGEIVTHALGHFALNTELYLCERDRGINAPRGRYKDLLYFPDLPVCNTHLAEMWKRVIRTHFAPPLEALAWLNNRIPGGRAHNVGANTFNDRDILNLLAESKPHLSFTADEEKRGRSFLAGLGIPPGARYVCLTARDSAYHSSIGESDDRQRFRDSSIENYVLAAEEMAARGFYVLRMGKVVHAPLVSSNPKIIDYAFNKMGDPFFDVYLGANCYMCLSSGTGFDAIPAIFRKPVSCVNLMPMETPMSSATYIVYIGKAHLDATTGRQLSLREIVSRKLFISASSEKYLAKGVRLEENSPEEIRDVVVETLERLEGSWTTDERELELQAKFRSLMPLGSKDESGRPYHGEFHTKYSTAFLKANPWWVER